MSYRYAALNKAMTSVYIYNAAAVSIRFKCLSALIVVVAAAVTDQ